MVDYQALIPALQAISSELEMSSLLAKFIKIVLQETKAQVAVVLLEEQGRWVIKARIGAEQAEPEVEPAVYSDEGLPVSFAFFERAIRSQEKVILPKTAKNLDFKKNAPLDTPPLFVIHPLLASQQLQGLLYLEVYSTPSPETFQVLASLTTQAAISLVNARTYHQAKDAISEQKSIEVSLKDNEERYRRLIELSFECIAIHIDSIYVYINPSGVKLFGFDEPQDLIGYSIYDFIHPDDVEMIKSRVQKTQTEGFEVSLTEQRLVRLDGTIVAIEVAAVPITYRGQAAIQVIIRDISQRKQAESQLKASEAKFRTLAETMTAAVFIFQGNKNCYVNRHAEIITGYTQIELLSMNFWDVIHPDHQGFIQKRGKARQEGQSIESRYEVKILAKDGTERWVEATLAMIPFEGKPAVLGTAFEITQRKKTEAEREQLLRAEHEQRLLTETLAQVFLALSSLTNLDDVLNEILGQVQKIVAYDAADIGLLEKNVLHTVRWQGYDRFDDEQSISLLKHQVGDYPLDVTVFHKRQPVAIPDTDRHPQWVKEPEYEWIRSFIGLPLCLGDRLLGILRLAAKTPGQFTQENLKYLQPFAQAAAIAIENARLYDQARQDLLDRTQAEQALAQSNQQLLALQNAGATLAFSRESQFVLDTVSIEMTNLMAAQGCIIYNWDSQANMISVVSNYNIFPTSSVPYEAQLAEDYPIIKQVLVSRRAEQIHINQNPISDSNLAYMHAIGAKTVVVLAMEYQDQLLGAVVVAEKKNARNFNYEEIALAQFLANQAASAIENARLFEKAQLEIIERQLAENALKESEANLRAIFDNSLQAFILLDQDYTIRAINKSARLAIQLLRRKTILVGDNFLNFISDKDLDKICHYFDRVLRGESTQHEYKIRLKDKDYWIECHYDPVVDEDRQVIGICFSTIDISDRKKKAEELAASRARLWAEVHTLLENTQTLVSRSNQEGLLEAIANRAKSLMKARGVVVILLNEDTQELENITPKVVELTTSNSQHLLSQGSFIETALSKQQLQVSSLIDDEHSTRYIQNLLNLSKTSTLICAPLVIHGKKLGVLLLWRDNEFKEHDYQVVSAFASQAALGIENAHLYRFSQQLAIQQERQRLARGLHDSVTQSIYSIGLAAETALKFLGDSTDDKTRTPIEYIRTLSKDGLTEMREQLYRLHPAPLREKDLIEALAEHCQQLSNQYELQINFQANLKIPLTLIQQDELYYIARESLWNIVKHAHATNVELILTQEAADIVLSVEDDGIGFDLIILEQRTTFGLKSVIQRAELLKGYVIPQSKPGHGTHIMVRIPVNPDQAEIQTDF